MTHSIIKVYRHIIRTCWQRPLPRLAFLTYLTLLAIVTILSLLPSSELPTVNSDKTVHFIAYMGVILPLAAIYPRAALWILPLLIAYSGLIELIQPLTNRYAEWADLLANSLGATCGVIMGLLIHRFVVNPRLKKRNIHV